MRKLRKKYAPIQIGSPVPAARPIITVVAVPKTIHLHQIDPAQAPFLEDLPQPLDGGRITVLHHGKDLPRHLQGLKYYRLGILFTDRKSTRLNSSHVRISYAVFCLKK